MTYFLPGLWHLAAATAFSVAFGVWQGGEPLHFLRLPAFVFALVVCSCAFFWVPDRWAKRGALKFLHYPLPDWDVLLLGPASHRNWLSHSALLPLLLLGALWHWPHLAEPTFFQFALGACIGVGSHLFWDCVGSQRHSIVIVPYWWRLREAASRFYLLLGAALSLCVGGVLCGAWSVPSIEKSRSSNTIAARLACAGSNRTVVFPKVGAAGSLRLSHRKWHGFAPLRLKGL